MIDRQEIIRMGKGITDRDKAAMFVGYINGLSHGGWPETMDMAQRDAWTREARLAWAELNTDPTPPDFTRTGAIYASMFDPQYGYCFEMTPPPPLEDDPRAATDDQVKRKAERELLESD